MVRTLIQPFLSHLTQSLAEVATLVARSLYKQAGGDDSNLNNITADPKIVSHMTTHTHSHMIACDSPCSAELTLTLVSRMIVFT